MGIDALEDSLGPCHAGFRHTVIGAARSILYQGRQCKH